MAFIAAAMILIVNHWASIFFNFAANFLFLYPIMILIQGIKARKKELGNKLSFTQGTVEGFKISLVYGIASIFILLLINFFVHPAFLRFVNHFHEKFYRVTYTSDINMLTQIILIQFIFIIIFYPLCGLVISYYLKTKS